MTNDTAMTNQGLRRPGAAQRLGLAVPVLAALLGSTIVRAEPVAEFSHGATPTKTASAPLSLAHGERFLVRITATDPTLFDYEVTGIEIVPKAKARPLAAADTAEFVHEHDKKFAGYRVSVTRKEPKTEETELVDKEWLIPVQTMQWETAIAGAFTVSGLTNPVFDVRDDGGSSRVTRNRSGEDNAGLGLAGFVHVFHGRRPELAGTFGLGVTNQSKTSYFTGLSWRWGDRGALTAGYMWGSVERLPSGVREGDVVTDPNVLANPGTRIDGAAFLAVSFSFINVGDLFQKPFAEAKSTKP
jgi:hypothetical protein